MGVSSYSSKYASQTFTTPPNITDFNHKLALQIITHPSQLHLQDMKMFEIASKAQAFATLMLDNT